jgi:hypothetical protein
MSRPLVITEISNLDLSPDAFKRLETLNGRTKAGSDLAIVAPIFGDKSPEDILTGWDSEFEPKSDQLRPTLLEMEKSNRSKFGPRSLAKPWVERRESTLSTFHPREEVLGNFDQAEAVDLLVAQERRRYAKRQIPLSVSTAATFLQPNTNSGLPFLVRKKLVVPEVVRNLPALLERNDPAVLFTRTQESRKTRDVWGVPVADVLEEMAYFQPLLSWRKRLRHRTALLGPEAVEGGVGGLLDHARSQKLAVVSVDFSSFDRSVHPDLAEIALTYLFDYF